MGGALMVAADLVVCLAFLGLFMVVATPLLLIGAFHFGHAVGLVVGREQGWHSGAQWVIAAVNDAENEEEP